MKSEIREALQRYAREGIPTGGYLRAVLENDLMEAFGRADEQNTRDMLEIVGYVFNVLPQACYGSPEKVSQWIASRKKKKGPS